MKNDSDAYDCICEKRNFYAPRLIYHTAQADLFTTSSQGVSILAGQSVSADFSLQSSLGSIAGVITEAVLAPIYSATIKIIQNGVVVARP